MSFTYWGIDGLGVCIDDILPMLDAEEIRLVMTKHRDGVFGGSDDEFEEYLQAGNDDRFEYLHEDLIRFTDQISGVIVSEDEKQLLWTSNNGDGGFYVFYPPVYPWERREGECGGEDEAKRYICDLLLRFTLPEVTAEQVLEKIDHIHEVGSAN